MWTQNQSLVVKSTVGKRWTRNENLRCIRATDAENLIAKFYDFIDTTDVKSPCLLRGTVDKGAGSC